MGAHMFQASDGIRLAYHVDDFADPWKPTQTLILLHSAMGNSKRFYAWVPRLSRRYRTVRMDLRGHGESEVPGAESPLTMDRLVADVAELMDVLDCSQAHFVGNSAGGYVAQNLAMTQPARVRSLALFGSTPGLMHSQARTWLPRVAEVGLRRFLADTIADRLPLDRIDPGYVEWFLDEAAKNDEAYIGRFIGLMTTLDWGDRLGAIACPTLVVMPGAETVGSTRNYDVMRERIPDVQLIAYEGMPHNICDALPDRCAEDVLTFLRWRFGEG